MGSSAAPVSWPEAVRRFLAAPRIATISTVDPDGSPHQAVIWYALDGDTILINSRVGRRWPQNLLRDPHLSLAVYEVERPFHWVGVKGIAELAGEGAAALADIMDLARRYGDDPETFRGQQRVTFRVHPQRIYEYDD
jgi:PPOX class probable F420-dependent enzyme